MPGEDGLSLTQALSQSGHTPILLLSAKIEASERILGFEMGADDYLGKPFEPRELLLRVEAILKRSVKKKISYTLNKVSIGHLNYNISRQELRSETRMINLTSLETKLLQTFAQKPNLVLDRDTLSKSISRSTTLSNNQKSNDRSIDVLIKRLRQKIEKDPKNPIYLKTIRGLGYILKPD